MKEINDKEFLTLLNSPTQTEYTDIIINIETPLQVDISNITRLNKFKNCVFKGKRLDLFDTHLDENRREDYIFKFDTCEFINDFFIIKSCFIEEFEMSKTVSLSTDFHLADVKIQYIYLSDFKIYNNQIGEITIKDSTILKSLTIISIEFYGYFTINNTTSNNTKIHNCTFKGVDITKNNFTKTFQFSNVFLVENNYIKKNSFEKTDFHSTDFGKGTSFKKNKFLDTALFQKVKNLSETNLEIIECTFEKHIYFNDAEIYNLKLDSSTFSKSAFFQNTKFNTFFIDRIIFESRAFFDDIDILNIEACDKRSIRNIKQQLLISDNKIDYDRFRVFELNAYLKDIKRLLKEKNTINKKRLRRDLLILKINKFYSSNGTDWVKAVKRTIILGITFYSLFFVIENYQQDFDLKYYDLYINGFFRYLLITDFHNPLIQEKTYLTKIIEWIPFIIGKILIGVGIFEIVQSFRKYKR